MTTYKAIPGYENYLIGTDGSVWSTRTSVPKNIKPQLQNSGYYYVTLYNQFGQKKYLIHRLVAEVFIGKSDLCINHKDAKKGKLEIEYYSQDELDRIIDMIRTIQK